MSQNKLRKFQSPNLDEFWLDERIFVRELMNSPEEPGLSLAKFRVPGNTTTQLHSIEVQEWYIIESGTGIMRVDDETLTVGPNDCFKIEPGQAQQITNTGDDDLVFQSICIPRWTPDTYKNLET